MRKLLCVPCGNTARRTHGRDFIPASEYEPAEYISMVTGILTLSRPLNPLTITRYDRDHNIVNQSFSEDETIKCDDCGEPIVKGSKAVALTIWRVDHPLVAWEYKYLDKMQRVAEGEVIDD